MLESKSINGEWHSEGDSFRTYAEDPIASQSRQMQPEFKVEPCDWEEADTTFPDPWGELTKQCAQKAKWELKNGTEINHWETRVASESNRNRPTTEEGETSSKPNEESRKRLLKDTFGIEYEDISCIWWGAFQ